MKEETVSRGVNLCGYVHAESGVGQISRSLAATLEAARIPYRTIVFDQTRSRQESPFTPRAGDGPLFDTNIVCVNADQLPLFAETAGRRILPGRYTVGVWAWEVDVLPEPMRGSGALVDEVWGISTHAAQCIAPFVDKPVVPFPLPVLLPEPTPIDRRELGLPEGFLFLFCFDYDSVLERKNPIGLIRAYERAFPKTTEAGLVIKSINGEHHPEEVERLRREASDRQDIFLIEEYLTASQHIGLVESCQAYVSLHRAEGFGLTLAEAMALGKPVIATGYSANLDFMNDENSLLVPFRSVSVPPGCGPYPTTASWAEPDLDAAVPLLRRLFERQDEARAMGERARRQIAEHHGPEARAQLLREHLERIWSTAHPGGPTIKAPSAGVPLEASSAGDSAALGQGVDKLLGQGPDLDAPSRYGFLARWLRRLVDRLGRNQALHQREVDLQILHALRELADHQHRRWDDIRAELGEVWRHIGGAQDGVRRLEASLQEAVKRSERQTDALESAQRYAEDLAIQLSEQSAELELLSDHLYADVYTSEPEALRTTDPEGRTSIGFGPGEGSTSEHRDLYLGFEEIFRGEEGFIRERQQRYVELLRGHETVIDLGCGRGELLDLLRDAGVAAVGVDSDPGMIRHSRAKGHEVDRGDALDFLERYDDGSVGAIFSAQVVEHLSHSGLLRLFELSRRKLRPGGLMIAETVNPHSLRALKAFWVDPTHRHPLFPETLVALCRLHGFDQAYVLFPNGSGELEADRRSEGEYAVVACIGPSDGAS